MPKQMSGKKVTLPVLPQFKPLVYRKRGIIIGGGRSRGASTAMAQAIVYFCSKVKLRVVVGREFMNSIEESAKAEIERWIQSHPDIEREWIITDKYLMHKYTLSTVKFRGLQRNRSSIKGLSGIDIFAVDEADSMSWDSWKLLGPTIVRNKHAEIWLIGNNGKKTTPFGTLFQNPPPGWLKIFSTYLQNPYTTQETMEQAEFDRRVLGEAVYQNVWLGAWEDASKMRLVPMVRLEKPEDPPEPDDAVVVIAVDVARKGGDKCVIVVRVGRHIVHIEKHLDMDLPKLTGILQHLMRRYKHDYCYVDSTGHGAWVPDALAANGVHVEGVVFNERAEDTDRYHDRRSEMYGRLGLYLQEGGTVPDDKELIEEIEASYFEWDHKSRPKLLSKDDIRPFLNGRSTDTADAVALTMLNPGDRYTCEAKSVKHKLESALNSRQMDRMGRFF